MLCIQFTIDISDPSNVSAASILLHEVIALWQGIVNNRPRFLIAFTKSDLIVSPNDVIVEDIIGIDHLTRMLHPYCSSVNNYKIFDVLKGSSLIKADGFPSNNSSLTESLPFKIYNWLLYHIYNSETIH